MGFLSKKILQGKFSNKQTNKYFIIPRHYTVYKGSKHQTIT